MGADEPGTRAMQGPTVSLRVDWPDGTAVTIGRAPSGTVTTERLDRSGTIVERRIAELAPDGSFRMTRSSPPGSTPALVAPSAVTEQTNAYGATTEHSRYDDGTTVASVYDDDASLREVTVTGSWGTQTLQRRPDGGGSLDWQGPLHRGRRAWDASGHEISYEVERLDGR